MAEVSAFDINAFINESKETLLNPRSYFSSMKKSGGMSEPIIKVVIYGAAGGILLFLWSVLGLGKTGILGGTVGALAFVWYILGAVISLFVGAVIVLIVSSVCKGDTDFEATLRVVASCLVILPVSALLGFITGINLTFGTVISVCINLYLLYMLYHGLVESLKATPQTTRTAMYILAGLVILFMLMSFNASRKLDRPMNNSDLKEIMKDSEKSGHKK